MWISKDYESKNQLSKNHIQSFHSNLQIRFLSSVYGTNKNKEPNHRPRDVSPNMCYSINYSSAITRMFQKCLLK